METAPEGNMSEYEKDFRICLFEELEEIMKYKWILGEKMKRDPLESLSMNDICLEWIEKYAGEFREYWNKKNQQTGTGGGASPNT